jgi:L-threonylcarbamoyladenylate synthase
MSEHLSSQIDTAVEIIHQGGVIAYPTEGVYGLGCSPFNEQAVLKLLKLKQRPVEKGLIVVSSDWQSVASLTRPIDKKQLDAVFATWPGAVTWVFPASNEAASWITGLHDSIALRISAFPVVISLCERVGPLVSTSANIATQPAAKTAKEVKKIFADEIDFILDAPVGNLITSTPIYDVISGDQLR